MPPIKNQSAKKQVDKSNAGSVLFIDDDQLSTTALIRSLERNGAEFNSYYQNTIASGLEQAAKFKPDVLVLDLCLDPLLGPESGLQAIADFLKLDSAIRILVLTGHSSDNIGVRALQLGAASFLAKPVDPNHLLALIQDGLKYSQLKRNFIKVTQTDKHLEAITGLRSSSAKMRAVIEAVAFAATNPQPVLIVGETGTGKGVIARSIHNASRASKGAFVRYQASFTGQDLVSSELFGHKRGAFTGANEDRRGLIETAHKGTLFIDEIDELPTETQILLLNVLQEKTFRPLGSTREIASDFRLLAATNRDLQEALKYNKLRQDFYHRIAHLCIEIPPLRERLEDVPFLAETFLQNCVEREKLAVIGCAREALSKLSTHSWPGNVRELQATVEAGVHLANYRQHTFVEANDINLKNLSSQKISSSAALRDRVRVFEEQLAQDAMTQCDNNQSKAAEFLGLDRSSFRRILARIQ